MKRFPIALAAAVALLGVTSAAFAQDVEINGSNVNQAVNANNNSNVAAGFDSDATQALGIITDTEITGSNVNQAVNANNNSNVSAGVFSDACQTAGAIGNPC